MIEKLENQIEYLDGGQFYLELPLDNYEIGKKLNELVEAVNRMEKQIEKLQVL